MLSSSERKMCPFVTYLQASSVLHRQWPKDQLYIEALLHTNGWALPGSGNQLGEVHVLEGVLDTAGCKNHLKRKPDFMNFTVQISRGFGWHSWPDPTSAYMGFVLAVCTGFGKLDWTQNCDTLFQLWPAERNVEKLARCASVSPVLKSLIWKLVCAFQMKDGLKSTELVAQQNLSYYQGLLLSLQEQLSP